MKVIRLIATDLDGTLFCEPGRIGARTVQALKRARAAGIHTVVASGKDRCSVAAVERRYGISGAYSISYNGACLSAPDGRGIFRRFIDPDAVKEAFCRLATLGVYTLAYGESGCFQWPDEACGYQDEAALHFPIHAAAPGSAIGDSVFKIVAVSLAPDKLLAAKKNLSNIDALAINASWSDNLEIMPKGVNKGEAVRVLTSHLGIAPGSVAAFGDELNDLEMLSFSGLSVAMGNACEQLRQTASIIAPDCTHEGVAHVIEELLDGKIEGYKSPM